MTQGKEGLSDFAKGGRVVPPRSAKFGGNKGTLCLDIGEHRR